MQKYNYTAVDLHNRRHRGRCSAKNEEDLRILLSRQGLYLLRSSPSLERSPASLLWGSQRLSAGELSALCRQLSAMLAAGVPLMAALSVLTDRPRTRGLGRRLTRVREDVKTGLMLSQALRRQGRAFPPLLSSMVYVGEQSGTLDRVLANCADHYENDARLRSRAKSAAAYPLFLLAMTLAIVVMMIAYVIPAFQTALVSMEVELPALTRTVMAVSDALRAWGLWLLAGGGALTLLLVLLVRTRRGKYAWHTLLLRLPLVGRVRTDLASARFARCFGLLLSGGMDLAGAMETVGAAMDDQNIRRRFARVASRVVEGQGLSTALEEAGLFSPILRQMVAVGEQTGELDRILLGTCDHLEEQARRSLDTMTSLLQPLLLGLMGGLIALLFLSLYSPMLSVMQTV